MEIKSFSDIDACLKDIDKASTSAIKRGNYLNVEWEESSEKGYTKKQRGALHVYCKQLAKVLNDAGLYCVKPKLFGEGELGLEWNMYLVKELIYKPLLAHLTGKLSTEDQSTVEPSAVAQHLNLHFAEQGLTCPSWPSVR